MNRSETLGDTLRSIVAQLPGDVEIVLVDGSEDSRSETVFGAVTRQMTACRYLRRAPQGVDRDYAAAVALSSGDYCWLYTDDDRMRPGAVEAVLRALESGPDCVIVNAEVRDASLGGVLEPRRLNVQQDRVYEPADFESLARDTLSYLSFVGAVVIRRALWEAREKERYFGSEFAHVGVLFQAPLSGSTVVLARPYISIRYGVGQWTRRAFRIWMINWPAVIWSLDALSERTRAAVTAAEPWRELRQVFWLRAKGAYSRREYVEWLKPRAPGPFLRLALVMLAAAPVSLVSRFGSLYLRWWRPHAKALLLDLDFARSRVVDRR